MKENESVVVGLKLACVYSWNCETARILKISELLRSFAELGNKATPDMVDLAKITLKFLKPYNDYREIAKDWKIENPFDYEVVANYWRPHSQTRKPKICHNWAILKRLLADKPKTIDANRLNETFVHAGVITRDLDDSFAVKYRPIITDNAFLLLGNTETIKVIKKAFVSEERLKGEISFHFSAGTEDLNANEAYQLTILNGELLNIFNKSI